MPSNYPYILRTFCKARYDEHTDVIEPFIDHSTPDDVWRSEMRRLMIDVGFTIVKRVYGWAPYTHLIRYGEPHSLDSWGYLLADVLDVH